MALDATIAGETSDSYVTLVEASAYFANHYSLAKSSAWVVLTAGQQESALKRACSILESLRVLDDEFGYGPLPRALWVFDYNDLNIHRLTNIQRLSFPRNIDVDSSLVAFIQQNCKDAQCEQASTLLAFDESAMLAAMSGLVSELTKAGPVETRSVYRTARGGSVMGTMLAPMALELMRQFIRPTGRMRRA